MENTNDPLTSFLKIIMGKQNTLVVDGRRLYNMEAQHSDKTKQTTIEISNYYNLWADHKRNKFEKIIFEKKMMKFYHSKCIFILMEGFLD